MFLDKPSEKYKESFLEALFEYQKEGRYLDLFPEELEADFGKFCKKFEDQSKGVNLKEGYVPDTTFWLIDGGEFIGRVSIRHKLTEKLMREGGHIGYDISPLRRNRGYGSKILELSLPEAKKLRLEKVLLSCDSTNLASKRIIEKNGGVFENEVEMGKGKPSKLRFWITL